MAEIAEWLDCIDEDTSDFSDIVSLTLGSETIKVKRCTKCCMIKPLSEFGRDQKGKDGYRYHCKSCKAESHARYRKENPDKVMVYQQRRRARKEGLPDDLTDEEWEQILSDFNERCALTGEKEDVDAEHFIPLAIHRGGTYVGNMFPMTGVLNSSKWMRNPFEWIKRPEVKEQVPAERWNALIEYLASQNGLTVDEFKDFVYWCFDNPRTLEQAKNDTKKGITSLDLWRKARFNHEISKGETK